MYTLDFETVKLVMQEHQMTGSLIAEVPSGVVGMHEPCRIEINLQAGSIVTACIIGNSGHRLTGKEFMKALSRLGRLNWTFTPQQEKLITQPLSPVTYIPVEKVFVPQRIVTLDQRQMQSWPRIHRVVFAMADGTKSSLKIAALLSTSPAIIDKVLGELQSIGVIIVRMQNRNEFT
jgi:hypothetical protein